MSDIGNAIREYRVAHGISETHACRVLGKPRRWLARRETGKVVLGAEDLPLIAAALHIMLDDLASSIG